jgi:hypothetical protein
MPTLTPQITLTATLEDLTGAAAGSTANPARLSIALCGFGATLPQIAGTATLAKIGPFDIPSTGATISTKLWGNDVIAPLNEDGTPATYYAITVYDGAGNVVQCAAYQFVGTLTIDLSAALPMLQNSRKLFGAVPNGAYPGSEYSVPVPIDSGTAAAALYYNGALQDFENFELVGLALRLNWITSPGDALFVQYATPVNGLGAGVQMVPYVAIANGVFPGVAYTIPTVPPGAQFVGLFLNGGFQQPYDATSAPTGYKLTGQNLVMGFATQPEDEIQALYMIGPPLTTATSAGAAPTITGAFPGETYTITTATPANGTLVGLFSQFLSFLRPGIDYELAGNTITMRFLLEAGDSLYAIYL